MNLRTASPPPLTNSPITPIIHSKGYPTLSAGQLAHQGQAQSCVTPVPQSPVKVKEQKDLKEHLKELKKESNELTTSSPVASQTSTPVLQATVGSSVTVSVKKEPGIDETDDMIEVDETATSISTVVVRPVSPAKAVAVRRRRTSSLAAEVAVKQEVGEDLDVQTEKADAVAASSHDGVYSITVHSEEKERDHGSGRKMTREERKLDAIMRAFEKMEQKQKRKQQDHKHVPGKDKDDRRRSSGSGRTAGASVGPNESSSDKRPPSTGGDAAACPAPGQSSSKKGRRKSSSGTPMKRGRARTTSGCSDTNNSLNAKDSNASNDCFAQPAKSKRLLMQGWLQEKHNGAELSSPGGESPSTGASTPNQEGYNKGDESVCFVRESHSVANAMAHLRRSSSLSTTVTGQVSPGGGPIGPSVGVNSNCGAGSAKKRWLRQAMCDDGDSTPEAPNSPSNIGQLPSQLPTASPTTDAPGLLEEDNHHESGHASGPDYVTPLKKRRLMRESVDSASPIHDSPHRSPHESTNDEHDEEEKEEPKRLDEETSNVDVVQIGTQNEPFVKRPTVVSTASEETQDAPEVSTSKEEHEKEGNHKESTLTECPVSIIKDGKSIDEKDDVDDEKDDELVVDLGDEIAPKSSELNEVFCKLGIFEPPKADTATDINILKKKPSEESTDLGVQAKSWPSDPSDNLDEESEISKQRQTAAKDKYLKREKEVKFANEPEVKESSVKEKEHKMSKEKDTNAKDSRDKINKDSKTCQVLLPKEPKSPKDLPKEKDVRENKKSVREANKPLNKSDRESKSIREKEQKSPKEKESRSPKPKETSSSKKDLKRTTERETAVTAVATVAPETADPFSRALVKEDCRPKDKNVKDKKEKHRKERKDEKRGSRDSKERSSVDEPVEEPKSASSTDGMAQESQASSPTLSKTSETEGELHETTDNSNLSSQQQQEHVSILPAITEARVVEAQVNSVSTESTSEDKGERPVEETEVEPPKATTTASDSSWEQPAQISGKLLPLIFFGVFGFERVLENRYGRAKKA